MPFRPKVNEEVEVFNEQLRFTEHPSAPGMPYGQTGRRATVYQGIDQRGNKYALKVFTLAFRTAQTEVQAKKISIYDKLPGLTVCKRQVITPSNEADILKEKPDLRYAVLMPWIQGQTWQEILMGRKSIMKQESSKLAENLIRILSTMEQNKIAHCDLSGPNLILNLNNNTSSYGMNLIDLEDMYAPGISQPEKLPAGSVGYSHKTAKSGLWNPEADRFSGAVLLAEILGWCDERVVQAAHGEQYFDVGELQENSHRFDILHSVLEEKWGLDAKTLFIQAWKSEKLEECPRFTDWAALFNYQTQEALIERQPIVNELMTKPDDDSPVIGWRSFTGEKTIKNDNKSSVTIGVDHSSPFLNGTKENDKNGFKTTFSYDEIVESGNSNLDHLNDLYNKGEQALIDGNCVRACEFLSRVVQINPVFVKNNKTSLQLLLRAENELMKKYSKVGLKFIGIWITISTLYIFLIYLLISVF